MPKSLTETEIDAEYEQRMENIPTKKQKKRKKGGQYARCDLFAELYTSMERQGSYSSSSYMYVGDESEY